MSLNTTTSSERLHIAFFGCRNVGKSSLVNAVTNQELSVVSDVKGTTTDPVKKAMELLPIGPVVIIDTAGLDDEGELGNLRIEKTLQVLDKTDIAILVADSTTGLQEKDNELVEMFVQKKIPYIIAYNKCDLALSSTRDEKVLKVSAKTGEGIGSLKELIGKIARENQTEKFIIKDKLQSGDVVILVIPIDESAPKGRIILPQQNVLREILDTHATALCCQPNELGQILQKITPNLVITDSQAFSEIKSIVPQEIPLTSFSILMARYKGKLDELIFGAKKISELKDGSKVLISEACTHHRQCNDIGTVKFPKWLKDYTGKNLEFEFTQGGEFPQDLSRFDLIIHCGGCMINETEMQSRMKKAKEQNIPMVNYGMAIAYMNGILDRTMELLK
ncbi:MAG: [FeFe] hydrogenase H-cluster maturation GTPase HydF [bacterium]|nr:[FeFe] hydrogenase H-cluster maturation GTPase HydF [bacterium]